MTEQVGIPVKTEHEVLMEAVEAKFRADRLQTKGLAFTDTLSDGDKKLIIEQTKTIESQAAEKIRPNSTIYNRFLESEAARLQNEAKVQTDRVSAQEARLNAAAAYFIRANTGATGIENRDWLTDAQKKKMRDIANDTKQMALINLRSPGKSDAPDYAKALETEIDAVQKKAEEIAKVKRKGLPNIVVETVTPMDLKPGTLIGRIHNDVGVLRVIIEDIERDPKDGKKHGIARYLNHDGTVGEVVQPTKSNNTLEEVERGKKKHNRDDAKGVIVITGEVDDVQRIKDISIKIQYVVEDNEGHVAHVSPAPVPKGGRGGRGGRGSGGP